MYKLITNPEDVSNIRAKDTAIADLMVVTGDSDNFRDYIGEVLLHTFDGFVSLSNPDHTWEKNLTMIVKLMSKGSIVSLNVY